MVTVAAGSGYGGKSRPAVVVQSDRYRDIGSVTVCLLTSERVEALVLRQPVWPSPANGLACLSWLMVDKLITVPADRIGKVVGQIAPEDAVRLDRALMTFLGLSA